MERHMITKRGILAGLCTLPLHSLQAQNRKTCKLIFILLRGGLDGLATVMPTSDPLYKKIRIPTNEIHPLNHEFHLHPALQSIYKLYQNKELMIYHAIGLPTQGKSHIDAQRILESGDEKTFITGWLGRSLAGSRTTKTYTIGQKQPLMLRGSNENRILYENENIDLPPMLLEEIIEIYEKDPSLRDVIEEGMKLATTGIFQPAHKNKENGQNHRNLGYRIGKNMQSPYDEEVAVIEMEGFDTHKNQKILLDLRLKELDHLIDGIKTGIQDHWKNTIIVVCTEFGRSINMNKNGGTDHGNASVAFVIGGNLSGGKVTTIWPGLSSKNTGLDTTIDLRSLFKTILISHLNINDKIIDQHVFPGLQIESLT